MQKDGTIGMVRLQDSTKVWEILSDSIRVDLP